MIRTIFFLSSWSIVVMEIGLWSLFYLFQGSQCEKRKGSFGTLPLLPMQQIVVLKKNQLNWWLWVDWRICGYWGKIFQKGFHVKNNFCENWVVAEILRNLKSIFAYLRKFVMYEIPNDLRFLYWKSIQKLQKILNSCQVKLT